MRRVIYSLTARDQLRALLAQGVPKFGPQVVAEKRDRVYRTVETTLARHPRIKRPHQDLGLVVYHVSGTPFLVLYDFDDHELRIHYVLHYHDDVRDLDPAAAVWD